MTLNEDTPRTGLDHLTDALAQTDPVAGRRALWDVVHAAEPGFTRAFVGQLADLPFHPDVDAAAREHLLTWPGSTTAEIFRALACSLPAARQTLAAISHRAPSPVHGTERLMLSSTLRRTLIAAGYLPDDAAVRTLTYRAADAFADALSRPVTLPIEPERLGGRTAPAHETPAVCQHTIDAIHSLLTAQELPVAA